MWISSLFLTVAPALSFSGALAIPTAHEGEWKDELLAEAERLEPMLESEAVQELLEAIDLLPEAEECRIHYRPGGYLAEAYTQGEHTALEAQAREGLREMKVDSRRFYMSFYGSPLAALRAYDLAAQQGIGSFEGKRVLDFGFGSIAQLELLALCGAEAVGTEVMPRLRAMYAEASGPRTEGLKDRAGAVSMVFGQWPATEEVRERVGGDFDVFVSKNTLKRGYVRPTGPVHPNQSMDLGVDPEGYLRAVYGCLSEGGVAIIYNLGGQPAAEGEAYKPATDIACPWSQEELTAIGFEVLAWNADDSEMTREVGHALGWDQGARPMDLENELFASYTLLRRR